jgi:recombination associated protein RdgC
VFIDLWQEKMFLGQEFLTWLWLASEIDSRFPGPNDLDVEVRFEKKIVLETGEGVALHQIACSSPDRDWSEAFLAVSLDKKIVKAYLTIFAMSFECLLALPADTLNPQVLKLIKGEEFGAGGTLSRTGRFLGQVNLALAVNGIIDRLFSQFLKIRLSADWEAKELPRLKAFIEPKVANI